MAQEREMFRIVALIIFGGLNVIAEAQILKSLSLSGKAAEKEIYV